MPTVEDGSEPDSLRVETLAKWGPDRRFGVDVQQPHVDRFAPDPEFEVKVRGRQPGGTRPRFVRDQNRWAQAGVLSSGWR